MREKELFEYAVIRIVPRVERGEFLNVGVVLYCAQQKFLGCRYHLDEARVVNFAPGIDIDMVKQGLAAFENICSGNPGSGPIGQLDIASRFRWLTAKRSTMIQTSGVHPGFCYGGEDYLEKLLREFVL